MINITRWATTAFAAAERRRKVIPPPPPIPVGPRRRPTGASGHRGVYRTKRGNYQARVRVAGVLYHCGMYATEDAAIAAVAAKLVELGIKDREDHQP